MFVAKVKSNQKGLLALCKEIEVSSSIDSHLSSKIKQSSERIRRDVFVYSDCVYSWSGVFIHSVIRVDKSIDGADVSTHYYVSNDTNSAEVFLERILQEWSVETMHFYKDTALQEDGCKTNKGGFSLSILRSIVVNILHLNKVKVISRKITDATYDLVEALTLSSMTRLKYGIIKW